MFAAVLLSIVFTIAFTAACTSLLPSTVSSLGCTRYGELTPAGCSPVAVLVPLADLPLALPPRPVMFLSGPWPALSVQLDGVCSFSSIYWLSILMGGLLLCIPSSPIPVVDSCMVLSSAFVVHLWFLSGRAQHCWHGMKCPSGYSGCSWRNLWDSFTPWVAIQASRCAGRVDRILAVKNPGVSLRPSYENGGRVVPPGTITVLLQYMLGEKGNLPIRHPDLIRPIYWVSIVGIQETCPAPVSTIERF